MSGRVGTHPGVMGLLEVQAKGGADRGSGEAMVLDVGAIIA